MKRFLAIFLAAGLGLAAMLPCFQARAAANSQDRQAQLRQQRLGTNSMRFHYSQPAYFHRKSPGKVRCVQLGQARCMGKKEVKAEPNKFVSPLAEGGLLHPFLRGKYKYKANSLFE